MIAIAMMSYAAHVDAIAEDKGNVLIVENSIGGYSIESPSQYRALGLAGAIFAGLLLPTLFYVPTMFVLFIVWFVQRQSPQPVRF